MSDQTKQADAAILPGQRWRSRDPRDEGLVVTVLSYSGPGGYVRIQRYNKTRVKTERFRKTYELVER